MIYLQPDVESGIMGMFDKRGIIHQGRQVPMSVEMSEVPTIELGKPFGRLIKSDISTESRLSSNPTSRDPLEERNLEVKGRLYFL